MKRHRTNTPPSQTDAAKRAHRPRYDDERTEPRAEHTPGATKEATGSGPTTATANLTESLNTAIRIIGRPAPRRSRSRVRTCARRRGGPAVRPSYRPKGRGLERSVPETAQELEKGRNKLL